MNVYFVPYLAVAALILVGLLTGVIANLAMPSIPGL